MDSQQSSLTACKMAATSIYVDPSTQAEIDMLSGIIYVLKVNLSNSQSYQHDFQMAYSFFFECFDSYCTMKDPRWKQALKYMVLMKVLKGNVGM